MDLEGRTALVTGGAHRVGRAITLALAAAGVRLVIHYNASASEAEDTAGMVRDLGSSAWILQADLRLPGEPERVVAEAAAMLGQLDVLVNSAAVMLRTPLAEATVAEWDNMFALNLRAPFFACQAAAPVMAERGGAIVNIADLAAFETWPSYIPHGITKAGIVQLTRSLARVLAPKIRVNAIAPGAVLLPDGWDADDAAHLVDTTPLRRLGSPGDVTQALLYLLRADYITGETLVVDGGRHIRT
ncbi:MAG TPA: SDR family oxidoreductase [Gemmatimonadaceae bacterium]|nr:SDR family oxidoreductase [Gemmatimonadaceae bacterium]